MSCSTYLYESKRRDEAALKLRIKEITQTRVHYGYRRVHVLLRREGYRDNVKRIYRLYREQGLSLRLKRPKRNKAAQWRQPKQLCSRPNELWSMDFVADALFDGYGETSGGGIRAGKQDPLFEIGNDYLKKNYPNLDYITTARITK